jgi:hypothetical protein
MRLEAVDGTHAFFPTTTVPTSAPDIFAAISLRKVDIS